MSWTPGELIGAVASCPVPVLEALGHATDDLVVARVADVSFSTPKGLGAWLRQTVGHKRLQVRQAEEARLLGESRELLAEPGRLRALEAALVRWRLLAALLGLALAGALVWLLLSE